MYSGMQPENCWQSAACHSYTDPRLLAKPCSLVHLQGSPRYTMQTWHLPRRSLLHYDVICVAVLMLSMFIASTIMKHPLAVHDTCSPCARIQQNAQPLSWSQAVADAARLKACSTYLKSTVCKSLAKPCPAAHHVRRQRQLQRLACYRGVPWSDWMRTHVVHAVCRQANLATGKHSCTYD